jgi:hypothetical protein
VEGQEGSAGYDISGPEEGLKEGCGRLCGQIWRVGKRKALTGKGLEAHQRVAQGGHSGWQHNWESVAMQQLHRRGERSKLLMMAVPAQ